LDFCGLKLLQIWIISVEHNLTNLDITEVTDFVTKQKPPAFLTGGLNEVRVLDLSPVPAGF
jgi:hypothetical protein